MRTSMRAALRVRNPDLWVLKVAPLMQLLEPQRKQQRRGDPMALMPVKELGSLGVITDIPPSRLPINAFSRAKNVRFDALSVTRSPVFRTIKNTLGFDPRHVANIVPTTGGFSTIVMASDTFQIREYVNGTVHDRNGSISLLNSSLAPYTSTSLADVDYLNRADRVPVYRLAGGTDYADLTHWDSTWRAESLRAFGDFLLGIGMTEGSTSYNQRVRWSNLALANSIPDSWSATDTTKSAGFNDLVQLGSPLIDGLSLGVNFILYSSDQVWLMEFVGGTFIFNFRKLFDGFGVVNQNCVVEVDNKHFVLDRNDIYMHDTHTKVSICDQRVKDYIFSGMDTSKYDRCFVAHNHSIEEIMFCYVSRDDMAEFTNGDRCNRAAVYNYRTETWSFMDLPNVSASTTANVSSAVSYADAVGSYSNAGGSYNSQASGFDQHLVFVAKSVSSDGLSSDSLYGVDFVDSSTLSFPIDVAANKAPYIERTGIDLDAQSPLTGYKYITQFTPQTTTKNSSKTFEFSFGASNLIDDAPVYETAVSFDSASRHKIDSRAAGRYLSYKMTISDTKDFNFTGFDADVQILGRR